MNNCWYCDKELTAQDNSEHLGICDDCYKEMFEQSNIIYTNLINKIADLEAKLAESEKDRLMWQEMYKSADRLNKGICETDIYPLQEENTKLKQQLAEKEKSFDWIYSKWQECVERQTQSKTEFAIQQLQRAKEFGVEQFNLDKCNLALARVLDKFDQIIKELEGE